ncbi:acyltransferase family protein [Pseudomonas frederiksbergensis]|uniref:Acyltransferase 3 domain-containing protein n=1 Tax=Pseudomonas frederiksbergensis TaxID=104087 RepID=A0A423KMA5_9PSED|nr:acyltransferase [Pseudomonas frederiksbergensis]RON54940.1 hypothetical protein BK665_11510 [Pseudomonas frederiksbergensis]
MDSSSSIRHVAALDGIRGWAALAVTFFHGILHFNIGLIERVLYAPVAAMQGGRDLLSKFLLAVFNGDSAVMIFFVLSGYVLSGSLDRTLDRDGRPLINSADFLVKRLARIYPAMFGCMLLYWAIFLLSKGWIVYPAVTFDVFWKSSTLYDITIHGPSWSLLVEVLAAPFVVAFVLLRRKYGFFALVLATCYSMFAIDYPVLVGYLGNLWPYLLAFAVGVGVASPQIKSIRFDAKPWHLSVAIIAFVFARHVVPRSGVSGLIAQTFIGGFVVYFASIVSSGAVYRFLVSKPSLFMGRVSYSFYLINVPILYLVWGVMETYFVQFTIDHKLAAGLGSAIISTAITIPLSVFSERFIERPGIKFGKVITFWSSSPSRQTV